MFGRAHGRNLVKFTQILQMSVFSQEILKSSCDGVEQGKRSSVFLMSAGEP